MSNQQYSFFAVVVSLALAPFASMAAEKVAYQKPLETIGTRSAGELVLTAAPRETPEEGAQIYGPVAKYLSDVLGRKVVYRHPGNWGVYQGQMQKGEYDLVFDGSHFNGWRAAKIQHNVLVKVPGEHVFVAVVKPDNTKVSSVQQLAGRTVCAHAPPNLGTLTLLKEFSNPSRQPVIVNTDGWDNIYNAMIEGKCSAAVLPMKFVKKNDAEGKSGRIIYKADGLPDNALSAGPRLSTQEQAKVVDALLSAEGEAVTEKLRASYGGGKSLVAARNEDFVRLGELLRNEWGYF